MLFREWVKSYWNSIGQLQLELAPETQLIPSRGCECQVWFEWTKTNMAPKPFTPDCLCAWHAGWGHQHTFHLSSKKLTIFCFLLQHIHPILFGKSWLSLAPCHIYIGHVSQHTLQLSFQSAIVLTYSDPSEKKGSHVLSEKKGTDPQQELGLKRRDW